MAQTQTIAGREVQIDGQGSHTVVMLHGWPDTARLWDATVAALSPHYRCVRFTLPGYAEGDEARAYTLDEVVDMLRRVVDQAGGGWPVTLLLHDWGCAFGYRFVQRHSQRVARVIGVDVGDGGSRSHRAEIGFKGQAMVFGYQAWLALSWRIGGDLGDRMARWMARVLRCPVPQERIHARMGYPYWIAWTGSHGSYRAMRAFDPPCPMLFVYGQRKPFMFHSTAWAESLARRPLCRVLALPTGHWVMLGRAREFHAAVIDWLGSGDDQVRQSTHQ